MPMKEIHSELLEMYRQYRDDLEIIELILQANAQEVQSPELSILQSNFPDYRVIQLYYCANQSSISIYINRDQGGAPLYRFVTSRSSNPDQPIHMHRDARRLEQDPQLADEFELLIQTEKLLTSSLAQQHQPFSHQQ